MMQQLPKFYVDPFIRFRVMSTNMEQCFFTATVETNQTKKMFPYSFRNSLLPLNK